MYQCQFIYFGTNYIYLGAKILISVTIIRWPGEYVTHKNVIELKENSRFNRPDVTSDTYCISSQSGKQLQFVSAKVAADELVPGRAALNVLLYRCMQLNLFIPQVLADPELIEKIQYIF